MIIGDKYKQNPFEKGTLFLFCGGRLDRLEHDYENLMEQVRLASQQRFGRQMKKLNEIAGRFPSSTASERAFRYFTIGRKNCMTINTVRGVQASAVIYSITETTRANGLNVYYYIKHLLEQRVTLVDGQGNIKQSELEPLMPWSKSLPIDCYSKRRS